jgi:drug/metabolite transporter (DMT)-like permease
MWFLVGVERKQTTAGLLLLVTAFIWGTAFVAQRAGMSSIGPFLYNGVRFLLGAAVVLPFALARNKVPPAGSPASRSKAIAWTVGAGLVLFAGSILQQAGLVTTTAGKAGFITGLYVVIVPLFAAALGSRPALGEAAGAALSATGLYLLCVPGGLSIESGDLLVLGGAFMWAAHVVIIGRISPRMNTSSLAAGQFLVNGAVSLVCAFFLEKVEWAGVRAAAIPILYGGIGSVGIAYTIQVAAQKNAPPTLATVIMSLEVVFAAVAGWALLDEAMTPRMLAGGALMLFGMLAAQITRR